jgi:mannose-6-phosphate isomerase-like protein (cupin superfamily)
MDAIRCVVTGHDGHGKAVIRSDERIDATEPEVLPGFKFYQLWGADEAPRFPDSGFPPSFQAYYPAEGGLRFGVFIIPSAGTPKGPRRDRPSPQELARAIDRDVPGLMTYHEPDGSGMHKTPTLDFEVVLAGRVVLEVDDGTRVELRQGDTVVQNGTRHRWLNVSDAPATIAVVTYGVHHDDVR